MATQDQPTDSSGPTSDGLSASAVESMSDPTGAESPAPTGSPFHRGPSTDGVDELLLDDEDAPRHSAMRAVVGIGASAGGLEALEQLFSHLPDDTGCAFVVIQHLAPDFRSLMDELLARHTEMPVYFATDGQTLEPNSIYLIPPRHEMIVSSGRLLLAEREKTEGLNLPIDLFLNSLASDQRKRAIGVVLSGAGSDGSRGVGAVHDAGGLALVQDPETAAFDVMPRSAITTGRVDEVLAPAAIATAIVEFALNGRREHAPPEMSFEEPEPQDITGEYRTVFDLLSSHHNVDFSEYKLGTIARRLDRRQKLLGCRTIGEYSDRLATDPGELAALYGDLLIGVTEFFRDPLSWQAVARKVMPQLIEQLPVGKELRCWVAGTASGEEAYTLAILIHEAFREAGRQPAARVFATDLHRESVDFAGAGVYPAQSISNLDERYRAYFNETDAGDVQISSEIRRHVVFAQHNLLTDPPFTNLDFISCRNMLIYLQPAAQRRALTLLHFGLRRKGALMLGLSESLNELENEFDIVDRVHKICTKRRDGRLPIGLRKVQGYESLLGRDRPRTAGPPVQQQLARAYDTLLDEYVPASILVDPQGLVLHTFGRAADLMQPSSGRSSLDVTEMVYPELRIPLASGLQRVQRSGDAVSYGGIRLTLATGEERVVRLKLRKLSPVGRDDTVIVMVEDEAPAAPPPVDDVVDATMASAVSAEHVEYLESELRYTQESLQATVEELEAINEELHSVNEELTASNEELQSSNEELHSVNEELYSVNREYELKIHELTQLTQDMDNLLGSTSIGTIFLDGSLCLRKYTPSATEHFNLISHDVGRPISHVTPNFYLADLDARLDRVMATKLPDEVEVRSAGNNWYLMRMHPYRTEANEVEGVVITFVDTQGIKDVTARLAARTADLGGFAYGVSHDLQEPVRAIRGLSQLLARRSDELVAPAATAAEGGSRVPTLEIVDQISEASERLGSMLDVTLRYSRVSTHAGEFKLLRLDEILERARARVDDELRAAGGTVAVGQLPSVRGEPQQLEWLFGELFTNSLKFASDQPLRIDVQATVGGDGVVRVAFTDNGIGVTADETGRVFDMFFRGEGARSKPGYGGGLSIVRRIMEHHGGAAGVALSVDRGLTISLEFAAQSSGGGGA